MVQIEHDLESVESWDPGGGGKLVPGLYEVKIVEVKVGDAQSGYPKLSLKLQVVDGEHIGAFCFGDRSLHPNALGYLRGMLDILNVYATGRSFDEQRLVGRFMKVQVVEYNKNDGSTGTKVDKMFRSDINDGKNDQLDISEGAARVAPKPVPRPTNGNGYSNGNGKTTPRPAATKPPAKASAPQQAPPPNDDDLPF